jgi:hypothetical protein
MYLKRYSKRQIELERLCLQPGVLLWDASALMINTLFYALAMMPLALIGLVFLPKKWMFCCSI